MAAIQANPLDNKKNISKSWHVFQTRKTVRQRTTIYQQSTTTSPQKHHVKNAHFRKTPCKNAPPPRKEKNNLKLSSPMRHAHIAQPKRQRLGRSTPALELAQLQLRHLKAPLHQPFSKVRPDRAHEDIAP